jgi:WXXGXW repeat (2 copies)
MKTNIVDVGVEKATPRRNETRTRSRQLTLPALLLLALIGAAGCTGYYSASPGYGPYYGGPGPYYGAYPGSVTVAVGDRPYYRGPGYWAGRAYYVWVPGHWSRRGVWIRGHYVLRR